MRNFWIRFLDALHDMPLGNFLEHFVPPNNYTDLHVDTFKFELGQLQEWNMTPPDWDIREAFYLIEEHANSMAGDVPVPDQDWP